MPIAHWRGVTVASALFVACWGTPSQAITLTSGTSVYEDFLIPTGETFLGSGGFPSDTVEAQLTFSGFDSGESVSIYLVQNVGGIIVPIGPSQFAFQDIGGVLVPASHVPGALTSLHLYEEATVNINTLGYVTLGFDFFGGSAELTSAVLTGRFSSNPGDRPVTLQFIAPADLTPVPEPGTLSILGLGVLGAAAARRRRSNNS